jgi:hypothetical protein
MDKIIFSNRALILHKYADWIIKEKELFKSLSPFLLEKNKSVSFCRWSLYALTYDMEVEFKW